MIDAVEQPLRIISPTGQRQDWPALRPLSAAGLSTHSDRVHLAQTKEGEESPRSPAATATPASVVAAAAELTMVITGTTRRPTSHVASHSFASTYASASESKSDQDGIDWHLQQAGTSVENTPRPSTSNPVTETSPAETFPSFDSPYTDSPLSRFPTRQTSLRHRISDGVLMEPSPNSMHSCMAFTDFTKAADTSSTSQDSRIHSPSPESFSRPRPNSFSRGSMSAKAMKTASRIPIPDSKKATVIDVKKNRLSGSMLDKPSPSFGSRRLASPEALKVLENGKMRRQLKRMPTDGSLQRIRTERMWEMESNATVSTDAPSLSYSLDTSPDGTVAPSSPDGHHAATDSSDTDDAGSSPPAQPYCPGLSPYSKSAHLPDATFDGSHSDSEGDQGLRRFKATAPPTNSPFTAPLPTIPSEALLSVADMHRHDHPSSELSLALSHLEGKGSPPKTDVDRQTLLNMFGHLKRSLDKSKKKSVSLAENAAMAEKYLAKNTSVESNMGEMRNEVGAGNASDTMSRLETTSTVCGENGEVAAMSKWSSSTPSDNATSPSAEHFASGQALHSVNSRKSNTASAGSVNTTTSIGYPSRTPAVPDNLSAQTPEAAATPPPVARRRSSPTLGKTSQAHLPGSVRAARQGMKEGTASFARTTASSESKKTSRIPALSPKTGSPQQVLSRGRKPTSMRKSQSQAVDTSKSKVSYERANQHITPTDTSQVQRPRSRSRYVLDKINDLFSGKRERQSEEIPPVPRIDEKVFNRISPNHMNGSAITPDKVPIASTSGAPQLPNTLRASLSSQIALHGFSVGETGANEDEHDDSSRSVENLTEHIVGRAQMELNPHRKARLLNFAKVCPSASFEAVRGSLLIFDLGVKRLAPQRTRSTHQCRDCAGCSETCSTSV